MCRSPFQRLSVRNKILQPQLPRLGSICRNGSFPSGCAHSASWQTDTMSCRPPLKRCSGNTDRHNMKLGQTVQNLVKCCRFITNEKHPSKTRSRAEQNLFLLLLEKYVLRDSYLQMKVWRILRWDNLSEKEKENHFSEFLNDLKQFCSQYGLSEEQVWVAQAEWWRMWLLSCLKWQSCALRREYKLTEDGAMK